MHAPPRTARFALVLLALVIVAGCGSSGSSNGGSSSSGSSENGVASKSPEAIVSASGEALKGVTSVHVSGSAKSEGKPLTLNLTLASGKGGRGSISQNGLSFQIIAIGDTVYINGSDEFWRHFGGNAAVQIFHGRWLKAPVSGQLGSLAALTNLNQLFSKLLAEHGKLAKGATTTVNGQKVIAVNDTTKGGTLYVATTGKPYPIQIAKTGSEAGKISFDQFNEPVTLTAPANAIDITKLTGAGG